jgi:hypothetical protein
MKAVWLTHPDAESIGIRREARERGIGKSTLHYIRKNARDSRPLKIDSKMKKILHTTLTEETIH